MSESEMSDVLRTSITNRYMKISCTLTDQEFNLIEPYIDCREWANPIQDEFIFYDPTEKFRLILALYSITYYQG